MRVLLSVRSSEGVGALCSVTLGCLVIAELRGGSRKECVDGGLVVACLGVVRNRVDGVTVP